MPITLQLSDEEAALLLRLLEGELTTPQMLVHQAMNPHQDLEEWRGLVERLVERFHAAAV